MLITRAQGAACRRAAERIAKEDWIGFFALESIALSKIGWRPSWHHDHKHPGHFDTSHESRTKNHALLALLWCAEIAGEE